MRISEYEYATNLTDMVVRAVARSCGQVLGTPSVKLIYCVGKVRGSLSVADQSQRTSQFTTSQPTHARAAVVIWVSYVGCCIPGDRCGTKLKVP